MNLWICSMECAGISEAGGVKNVTFSLCKEFSKLGHKVTLFIPVFKCTSWDFIKDYRKKIIPDVPVFHCGKNEYVTYESGFCNINNVENFNIVFIRHPAFYNKEGIYTYTAHEQEENPEFVKGTGHVDTLFMDSLYSKAVALYGNFISSEEVPDIIHCQDASTALTACFAKKNPVLKNAVSVVTIHNAGPAYHHNYSSMDEAKWYTGFSEDELYSSKNDFRLEPFLMAVSSGAYLTTVSEDYAKEIVNPDFNGETEGLASIFNSRHISIKGITNGIDFDRYNPENTEVSCLPYSFSPEKNDLDGKIKCRNYLIEKINLGINKSELKSYGSISGYRNGVFICYHGRVTSQKGLNVLIQSIPAILKTFDDVRFIIAGQGEVSLEKAIVNLTVQYEGKVCFLNGYDKIFARLVNASGDFIVLPSFFEPCGLEDFISQLYGTLPVAHATGGLKKIIEGKTGFLYSDNDADCLIAKLSEAISVRKYAPETIKQMISYAAKYVRTNYMWESVVSDKYLQFFEEILKKN